MIALRLTKSQRLIATISISAAFFVAEITVGFYTRSLALVADAFHYMNDLIGFIVALAALKISENSKSPKQLSFGWQRATLLGAFFNGVFLLALGLSIFLQAIERFVAIQRVENPKMVLIIGCIGLALNIISASFLHEHEHDDHNTESNDAAEERGIPMTSVPGVVMTHDTHRHRSPRYDVLGKRKGHDLGLLGVLIHVMGDAANNIGVIIAAATIWKLKNEGRFYADPGVSMGIAIMILMTSVPFVKKSGSILLQRVPFDVDPDDVKHDLETIPGIVAIHDLHIWQLNQQKAVASAHLTVSSESMADFTEVAQTAVECLHAYGIHSATLQPEAVQQPAGVAAAFDVIHGGPEIGSSLRRRQVADPDGCQIGCRATVCEQSTCCN